MFFGEGVGSLLGLGDCDFAYSVFYCCVSLDRPIFLSLKRSWDLLSSWEWRSLHRAVYKIRGRLLQMYFILKHKGDLCV